MLAQFYGTSVSIPSSCGEELGSGGGGVVILPGFTAPDDGWVSQWRYRKILSARYINSNGLLIL